MSSFITVDIADNTLVAPRDGRIQYRVANVGEVLPAGGKVFTMLDISYVYMDIYLPTQQAGKVKFGADARIVLDANPSVAIPAKISFIATQAQFTPKTVETQDERDKTDVPHQGPDRPLTPARPRRVRSVRCTGRRALSFRSLFFPIRPVRHPATFQPGMSIWRDACGLSRCAAARLLNCLRLPQKSCVATRLRPCG
jgi:hypothetical protein